MSILSQSAPDRMLSPAHLPQNILLPSTKHSIKSKFKLPPAVVNVPPDHIRGYVHTKKVDSYLVGNTLGEGSFAKVKEAFHVLVGEKVAMKIIDKKKAQQDPYVAKNFRREAKLLQLVRHPNILQLLEVIETDSSFYLITELCSGGELMKYIYKKKRLDEDETRKFMRHIVSAVDHLHRAGIIHRDLKVENMLLDANMDIKIIDFGLSNEEFVQGEHGMIHCSTQCGSPAYAAPELLGHKNYGPQVDIWSIGVNMYAMLTGCLPYTVEPFNITALHAKMLENKMNPIPDHLSASCKDLLRRLLKSNPDERLKMAEIMSHPWMNEGHSLPFGPSPYPNWLQQSNVDVDILEHMVQTLKIKDSEDELCQEVTVNKSTQAGAIYHLLAARLGRYNKQFQSKSRTRSKFSRVSRDHGYFEGDDDDDKYSIASVPTRTRNSISRQSTNTRGNVNLRPSRPGVSKSRPFSHPTPVEEEPVDDEIGEEEDEKLKLQYRSHKRRSTMPEMMLKEDIEKVREKQRKKEMLASRQGKRPITRQNNSVDQRKQPPVMHPYPHGSVSHDATGLAPLRHGIPKNYSTPTALNLLRNDLHSTLGPVNHGVTEAWNSNPSSRNASQHSSRNPSRQGTRKPSMPSRVGQPYSNEVSRRTRAISMGSELNNTEEEDEMVFHPVQSNSLPRRSSNQKLFSIGSPSESVADSSHLPSITGKDPTNFFTRRKNASPERRKNGYTPHTKTAEIRTDLGVDEIITKLIAVTHSMKMREIESSGSKIICTWSGIKFQVSVSREDSDSGKLTFQWVSGGDLNSYGEKCDKLLRKLKKCMTL